MAHPHPKTVDLAARVLESRWGSGAELAKAHLRTDAVAWRLHEVAVRTLAELAELAEPGAFPPPALASLLPEASDSIPGALAVDQVPIVDMGQGSRAESFEGAGQLAPDGGIWLTPTERAVSGVVTVSKAVAERARAHGWERLSPAEAARDFSHINLPEGFVMVRKGGPAFTRHPPAEGLECGGAPDHERTLIVAYLRHMAALRNPAPEAKHEVLVLASDIEAEFHLDPALNPRAGVGR